jgi:hypothetical protein
MRWATLETRPQLVERGHHEPRRRRRRRRPHVGREIAQRRVLLVPDGRHDRDAAARDRADDPLVAEREQILEAPTAACQHDDVTPHGAERGDRADDRGRRRLSPDARLGDDETHGGAAWSRLRRRRPARAASTPVTSPTALGNRAGAPGRAQALVRETAAKAFEGRGVSLVPTRLTAVMRKLSSPRASYS